MAFGALDRRSAAAPIADINMVPLIDVMLVLLVIFIVTAPLLTHAVKLDLPRANAATNPARPDRIEFAIDAQGQRYWNGEPVGRAEAARRLDAEGRRNAATELHLRADRDTRYAAVAETLADAARAGLTRIGFVSTPDSP